MRKKQRSRKLILLLMLLLSIFMILLAVGSRQELRQKAAPATTVSFVPGTLTTQPGNTFTLTVELDTGENTVTAIDLTVSFDKSKLKAQSIQPGEYLPNVLTKGSLTESQANIALACNPTDPRKGKGTLATITFQALAAGTTRVVIDNATQIAGLGEQGSVLAGTSPATITIQSSDRGSLPSPTTKPPSVSNTPTPAPPQANTTNPSCRNACGDGICQHDTCSITTVDCVCGESPFTCPKDCKPSAAQVTTWGLQESTNNSSDPILIQLINKLLRFFGILK